MAPPGAPHDEVMRGIHVYMGGIGMQEAFIVFFVVLVVRPCCPNPSFLSSSEIYGEADVGVIASRFNSTRGCYN